MPRCVMCQRDLLNKVLKISDVLLFCFHDSSVVGDLLTIPWTNRTATGPTTDFDSHGQPSETN